MFWVHKRCLNLFFWWVPSPVFRNLNGMHPIPQPRGHFYQFFVPSKKHNNPFDRQSGAHRTDSPQNTPWEHYTIRMPHQTHLHLRLWRYISHSDSLWHPNLQFAVRDRNNGCKQYRQVSPTRVNYQGLLIHWRLLLLHRLSQRCFWH